MGKTLLPMLLTVQQAALILAVPASWVYARCRVYLQTGGARGIPCRKVGTYTRIFADGLEAWVHDDHQTQAGGR